MNKKLGLITGLLMGSAAFADADGLKVSGFADAEYNWAKDSLQNNTNSFSLHDAAVYLDKKVGVAEGFIELPFMYDATKPTSANLAVGRTKAQAYVTAKYENGFSWKMGQFASIYGFESNDAPDIVFAHTGLLHDTVTPIVETGLQVNYDLSDMLGVSLLASNPHDQGFMTAGNPDFGFKVATKFNDIHASLGGLFYENSGNNGYLFSVVAGTKVSSLSFDLEATFDKQPTPDQVTRLGLGLFANYPVAEKLNAGARVEFTQVSGLTVTQVSVGPQYGLEKDLTLKLDYTFTQTKNTGLDNFNVNAVNVAAVQKF